jgi:outer membrane autotransporter protein
MEPTYMIRTTKLSLLTSVSLFAMLLGSTQAHAQSVVVNGSNVTSSFTLGAGNTLTYLSANSVTVNNSAGAVITISGAGASINTTNAAATGITTTGSLGGPVINITAGGTGANITNATGITITEAAGSNQPVIQSASSWNFANNGIVTSNSTGPVINLLAGSNTNEIINDGTISNTGSGTAITMATGATGTIINQGTITGAIDNSANASSFTYDLGTSGVTGAIKLGTGNDVVNIGFNGSIATPTTSVGAITGGTGGGQGTVNVYSNYTTTATIGAVHSVAAVNILDGINLTANNNITATAITIGNANTSAATLTVGTATVSGTVNSDGAANLGKLVANGTSVVSGIIGGLHALSTITVNDGDSLATSANVNTGAITLGSANTTGGTLMLGGNSTVAGTINSDGVGNHGILDITGNIVTSGVIGGLHGLASITVNDGDSLSTTGNVTAAAITLGSANTTGGTLTLNGTGTVSGTINSDGAGNHGILAIDGNITTAGIIGGLHGLASTTIANGDALTFDNSINSTALTVNTGGTLNVGATGKTLTGTLANNGTLNLGANSLTVTGAITGASSTINLAVGNTQATTGTIISTSGTGPIFTTALTINPTVSGTVLKTGDQVVLFRDTAATATLPAATIASSSLLLSWNASVAAAPSTDRYGNAITAGDIVLTTNAVNASTISGVTPRAASAVNGLTGYMGSDANVLSLLSSVQNLTSTSDINKAGAQLAPEINGAVQETAFGVINQAYNIVSTRNDNIRMAEATHTGLASGEGASRYGFWMQGFGYNGNQSTVSGVDGFNSTTYGTALGGDAWVMRRIHAGASFVFANTGVNDSGDREGSNLNANSYVGTLYATYSGNPWYVDMNVAGGYQSFDSTRLVNFTGAPVQVAKGSFGTQQYGFKSEFGYPITIAPQTVLTPVASFGYTYLNQDSYSESGAPGADLNVNSSNTYSARTGLGAKMAAVVGSSNGWTFKPNGQLIWQHEFNSEAPDQTSTFSAAGGTTFTTAGLKLPEDTGIAGIGLDVLSQDGWTVSAKYDVELRDQYFGEGGLFQVRKDF